VTTAGTAVRMSYHKIVRVNLTEIGFSFEPLLFALDERRLVRLTQGHLHGTCFDYITYRINMCDCDRWLWAKCGPYRQLQDPFSMTTVTYHPPIPFCPSFFENAVIILQQRRNCGLPSYCSVIW